ncbi:MAG: hypothetical protein CL938_03280 [Deltaproteobacteria bacterium]|jgi:hypothetical protein|nr:hypothetical protein [Deltaproteobacteria bacterium]|tara:strand:- start:991 stop:1272 length:282 start_codon:yes stop_codon:yes gene_type:complete
MKALANVAELRLHRLRMRRYYRMCFEGPGGKIVLSDLKSFCRSDQDLFDTDARKEAYLLGMRRVLLRITSFLNMSLEDVEAFGLPHEVEEDSK